MYIVSSDRTGEFKSCKVEENCLVVEYPTTDPNVLGSNPDGAEAGIHVLHKLYTMGTSSHWLAKEANIENGLV